MRACAPRDHRDTITSMSQSELTAPEAHISTGRAQDWITTVLNPMIDAVLVDTDVLIGAIRNRRNDFECLMKLEEPLRLVASVTIMS
jgi:hypothetical protein